MTSKNQILAISELERELDDRVSLEIRRPEKQIFGKIINENFSMQRALAPNPGTYIQPLVFQQCTFNGAVDIGIYQNAGKVDFRNCVFSQSINVHLENCHLSENCVFNSNLKIHLSKEDAEISNYNVYGELVLFGAAKKLVLCNINEQQKLTSQSIRISGEFSELLIDKISAVTLEISSQTRLEEKLKLKDISVSNLLIGMIFLNKEMIIDNCRIGNVKFQNTTEAIKGLNVINSVIQEIEFPVSALLKFSIVQGKINTLRLYGANEETSIMNIEKTTILNLKFEGIFNNGQITLRELNIPENGIISFKSSNLGKADFIYCNFAKANLEFENSKITEAFFSETEFPKKVLANGKVNYGQAQLTFGQLGTAFKKQGDNIRALEYTSRELEAHYKKIKWFSVDFFQKFNLWLNSISNNFGRNWARGICFSFAIGLLFFCLLLVSTDSYSIGLPEFKFEMLPAYLKFMNPLRFYELDALFNNTPEQGLIRLNGFSYLADFTGRIFTAYGYYQTIQAFRRFGRK
jgi:uncharacterized protein YjbI with pentapeptide repeats